EREAVEREREERSVADPVAEAGAGDLRRALHVEPAELEVVLRVLELWRLAPAPDLRGVVLGVAVGHGLVRRVRDLLEQRVPRGFGLGELGLERLELLLHALQLLDLLRRRLARELLSPPELVDPRDERAPAL